MKYSKAAYAFGIGRASLWELASVCTHLPSIPRSSPLKRNGGIIHQEDLASSQSVALWQCLKIDRAAPKGVCVEVLVGGTH